MNLVEKINKSFLSFYQKLPSILVRAPGRINIIGEHTDYNLGLALPAAINRYIYFGFSKNNSSSHFSIQALDLDESFNGDLTRLSRNQSLWKNYLIGILIELAKKSNGIGGFNVVITGNIPIGAGLSSSAAFECGFAVGLNELFSLGLSPLNIALTGKASENNFLGINSGLLDQFACMFGRKDNALLLNCENNSFQYIPLDLKKNTFFLVDTKVKHEHLTSGYVERTIECSDALQNLQKANPKLHHLSEVTPVILKQNQGLLTPKQFKRVSFITDENLRVKKAVQLLKSGNFTKIGELLNESHAGLKNLYEVSCEELDKIVEWAQLEKSVLGARMMGGGFGGCVLLLAVTAEIKGIGDRIKKRYEDCFGIDASIYDVRTSDGANIIEQ